MRVAVEDGNQSLWQQHSRASANPVAQAVVLVNGSDAESLVALANAS